MKDKREKRGEKEGRRISRDGMMKEKNLEKKWEEYNRRKGNRKRNGRNERKN
jgi:hypothetical protein